MAKARNTDEVTIERRSTDRRDGDRRQKDIPVGVDRRSGDRRKTPRRRQIDPTTCERDYSSDEIEFMQALDAYKRTSGRMFPTCSEILEVIRAMGYVRVATNGETSTDEIAEPSTEIVGDADTTDETAADVG